MAILAGFAPFILFMILIRFIALGPALAVNAVVAGALCLRDWRRGRLKVLDVGNVVLFVLLAGVALLAPAAMGIEEARLAVSAGLLAIVLVSLAIRRPFTLAYAREQVPPENWGNPLFIRANYVITSVWALAFAVSLATSLAGYLAPSSATARMVVEIAGFAGAIWFTTWYPKHLRTSAPAAG